MCRTSWSGAVVAGVVVILLAGSAHAQVLTKCGASKGQAYFFEQALVPEESWGWGEDEITDGSILLLLTDDKLDIIFQDATKTASSRGQGAEVVFLGNGGNDGYYSVLVLYTDGSGSAEHYLFKVDNAGVGEVVWTTVRPGLIQKVSMFRAQCSTP